MTITEYEAHKLFDSALDLLNNVDDVTEKLGLTTLTVHTEHYEALIQAVSTVMRGNSARRRA